MRKVKCVGFRTEVPFGGIPSFIWSKRQGEHNATMKATTCIELDNRDIQLTWTGGSEPRIFDIPRTNVAYIEYEFPNDAPPVKEAKK